MAIKILSRIVSLDDCYGVEYYHIMYTIKYLLVLALARIHHHRDQVVCTFCIDRFFLEMTNSGELSHFLFFFKAVEST